MGVPRHSRAQCRHRGADAGAGSNEGPMDMSTNQGELNIYLTPVTAERADDFEAWLRSTLFPAVAQVRPDLAPRAQTWRSDARQGLVYFAFLLEGDDSGGWQIDPILREALGDSATEAAWREWEDLVVAPQIGGAFRRLT